MATTRSSIGILFAGVFLASFLGGSARTRAGDEGEARPGRVEGVVYEVFHGDSIHRMGVHVREIHVPSLNLAFYVANGELRVFRPEAHRYALPGERMKINLPNGERASLPVLSLPGTETKLVGKVWLEQKDLDRLKSLLDEKTRLRAVADAYLSPGATYETVAAFLDMAPSVFEFVTGRLDAAGIPCVGTSNAGGTQIHVPSSRAEDARRLLLDAIASGLAEPPAEPDAYDHFDYFDYFDYLVIDSHGNVVWQVDRTLVPPAPAHADVLEHLKRFPGSFKTMENRASLRWLVNSRASSRLTYIPGV